jgi:hypothetical protein
MGRNCNAPKHFAVIQGAAIELLLGDSVHPLISQERLEDQQVPRCLRCLGIKSDEIVGL